MEVAYLVAGAVGLLLLTAIVIRPEVVMTQYLCGYLLITIVVRFAGLRHGVLVSMFVLTVLAMAWYRLRVPVRLFSLTAPEIAFGVLGIVLLLSLVYSPARDYGLHKSLRWLGVAVPVVWAGRILSTTPQRLKRTLDTVSTMAFFVLAFYAVLFLAFGRQMMVGGRFTQAPLLVGWSSASAGVLILYRLLSTRNVFVKIVCVVLLLVAATVIVASGSRGPFFGIALAALFTFVSRRRFFQGMGILVLLAVVAGLGFWVFAPEEGVARITEAVGGVSETFAPRTVRYMTAVRQFIRSPLVGQGAGAFGAVSRVFSKGDYPHNIFLEVAAETGLAGLIPLGVGFGFCVRWFMRARSHPSLDFATSRGLRMLFWVGLFETLASFDMAEHPAFFGALGLLAGISTWPAFVVAPAFRPAPASRRAGLWDGVSGPVVLRPGVSRV